MFDVAAIGAFPVSAFVASAKPSDYDVAKSVEVMGKVAFYAQKNPAGYVASPHVGNVCCSYKGPNTLATVRTWTPNGCSARCNQTEGGMCTTFSFLPQATLCVLCSRCNETSTDKDWRSFARSGSRAAQVFQFNADRQATQFQTPQHGLVTSNLIGHEAWEQLPPRTTRLGAAGCDGTTRKGRKGLRSSCNSEPKLQRCAEAVASGGRAYACRRMCFCSRCSPSCADYALRWHSPSGVVEARSTLSQPRFTFAYSPSDIDMTSMTTEGLVEPAISRAWHGAVHGCCAQGGSILDVGGNYGWYTLFSLAMGCSATVVEPVPAYQRILRLGLSLNPGFNNRTRLFSSVVYHKAGAFNVTVPQAAQDWQAELTGAEAQGADGGGRWRARAVGEVEAEVAPPPLELSKRRTERVRRGMAGMSGEHGVLKREAAQKKAPHVIAHAILIDEIADDKLCAIKIDVEGYEPQALASAARLFARRPVPVLQFELNKFNNDTLEHQEQMCAFEHTLVRLEALGYRFRELPNFELDRPLNISSPAYRKQLAQEQRHLSRAAKQRMSWRSVVQPSAPSWAEAAIFPLLPQFPSVDVRSGVALRGQPEEYAIVLAYREFRSYSTNLVGVHDHRLQKEGVAGWPWPKMGCE